MMKQFIFPATILLILSTQMLLADSSVDSALPSPMDVETQGYHSEIAVTWSPATLPSGVVWEVYITPVGKSPDATTTYHTVETPSFVFEHLDKGVEYTIHIRSKKGDKHSVAIKTNEKTHAEKYPDDSPLRVPHLCTLAVDGSCPKDLPLFYNGLANTHATFTYIQDGETILPTGRMLHLKWNQPEGVYYQNSVLEILIDEGEHGKWKLTYHLDIRKSFTAGQKKMIIPLN